MQLRCCYWLLPCCSFVSHSCSRFSLPRSHKNPWTSFNKNLSTIPIFTSTTHTHTVPPFLYLSMAIESSLSRASITRSLVLAITDGVILKTPSMRSNSLRFLSIRSNVLQIHLLAHFLLLLSHSKAVYADSELDFNKYPINVYIYQRPNQRAADRMQFIAMCHRPSGCRRKSSCEIAPFEP